MNDLENHFERGAALVKPYVILSDVPPRDPNTEEARKDIRQGIEYLKTVIETQPGHWPACWLLGKAFQATGDAERAYEYFKMAHEIEPGQADVCRELLLSCLELGHADEGVPIAWEAVRSKPDNAGLQANLALALLLDAKLPEAIEAVEKALELDPTDELTKNVLTLISQVQSGERPQPRKMSDLT